MDGRCSAACSEKAPAGDKDFDGNIRGDKEAGVSCPSVTSRSWDGSAVVNDGETGWRCPDGSCRAQPASLRNPPLCPHRNGCPTYKPFLCSDGTCAGSSSQCSGFLNCPSHAPILCENGQCVTSSLYCPRNVPYNPAAVQLKSVQIVTPSGISAQLLQLPCADGRNVTSSANCTPVWPCEGNDHMCGDGTCRSNKGECPEALTCPVIGGVQLVRCPTGGCVLPATAVPQWSPDDAERAKQLETYRANCPVFISSSDRSSGSVKPLGCPGTAPQNCANGRCIKAGDTCPAFKLTALGCPPDKPRCCNRAGSGTCPPSSCHALSDECPTACQPGELECADGKCVTDLKTCTITIICPSDRPVLCDDGSCVGRAGNTSFVTRMTGEDQPQSQCRPVWPCHDPFKYCPADSSCRAGECPAMCPAARPMQCPDGSCVIDLTQCAGAEHQVFNSSSVIFLWKPLGVSVTVPMTAKTEVPLLLDKSFRVGISMEVPPGVFFLSDNLQGSEGGSSAPPEETLLAEGESQWSAAPISLDIRSVPEATLAETTISYQIVNETADRIAEEAEETPFFEEDAVEKNETINTITVGYKNGVVSPVVFIGLSKETQRAAAGGKPISNTLAGNITLTFLVRAPLANPLEDYCLAYIDSGEKAWACAFPGTQGKRINLTSTTTADSSAMKLSGPVDHVGRSYAIIYKPADPEMQPLPQKTALWEQWWWAFLTGLLLLCMCLVGGAVGRKYIERQRRRRKLAQQQAEQDARDAEFALRRARSQETEETVMIDNPLMLKVKLRQARKDQLVQEHEHRKEKEAAEEAALADQLSAEIAALEMDLDGGGFGIGEDGATGGTTAPAAQAHGSDLPYPWSLQLSEADGRHYYWNSETEEASWEMPSELQGTHATGAGSPAMVTGLEQAPDAPADELGTLPNAPLKPE